MTNIDIDETSELVSFPIQRTCPFAIPSVYTKFREEAPVSEPLSSCAVGMKWAGQVW